MITALSIAACIALSSFGSLDSNDFNIVEYSEFSLSTLVTSLGVIFCLGLTALI